MPRIRFSSGPKGGMSASTTTSRPSRSRPRRTIGQRRRIPMAKRKARPPGGGSVYQRGDGKWVAQLPVGRGTRAGRERKYLYASSPEEAEARLTEALRALEQGLAIPDP